MTKRYTPFRLILLLALFVIPYLLRANGDPTNPPTSGPKDPDLSALRVGHCNPITLPVVNCATQQIELSAYVSWTFSGLLEPIVATWNTGQVAHKITITNADLPGQWNWDASGTGCEPNHWNTDYNQPGTFFTGDLVLESFGAICPGESTVIDVESGGYDFPNYNWSPPNPTGQLTPYEIFAPGNYSLTVVDQIGCPFTEQINIPLSPTVNPVLSGTPQMCPEGDTGMVQVNQMWNAYMWGNGQTTNSIVITEPGLYEVTVTNNFGCTGVGLFGVLSGEVGAFPISMTAPAICVGQPDTLRVVGGYSSYMWSNNVSGITNIVTQPGTYTVTVTNFIGCTGTGSVTVAPLPTPTIAITTTPFCPGDTSTLTVTGGNFPNYSWSGGQTGNPIIATQPGTYTVTVSGATICATSTNVALVQNPAPTTTIANPAQLNCSLPQTMIDAGGTSSGPQFSYTWTTVGGNFVSGQDSLTPVVNAAGTYTLVTTNTTTGCTSSASVTVTSDMQAPPAPAGNPATLTCAVTNFNIGPALPPADTTLLPVWSTVGGNIVSGQNSWNPNVDAPGTYILTVTNPANNCTSTASVLISEDVAAPNSLIAPPSQLTCTMNTVALDGSGSSSGPNFNYQWSTLDGTISGNTNTAVSAAASVGTYTLLVTNSTNGCTATSSVTVTADVNIDRKSVV